MKLTIYYVYEEKSETGELLSNVTIPEEDIQIIPVKSNLMQDRASKVIGDWRLEDCTLYVTLEPCQMCAGAIVQARIPKVVMASMNPKAGCAGSILNILDMPQFNHQVEVVQGVLDEECSRMLKEFFVELRARNKQEKLARMQQERNSSQENNS